MEDLSKSITEKPLEVGIPIVEKYHIHLFCFLWFIAHQLMGTDKKKTKKTTKLNALFILTARNVFYIYELGQYTSSHISALGESLEETLK